MPSLCPLALPRIMAPMAPRAVSSPCLTSTHLHLPGCMLPGAMSPGPVSLPLLWGPCGAGAGVGTASPW